MNKVSFLLLILIIGCTQKEDSTPSKTLDEILQADNAGDLEKVISNYTDDAILIPAGDADIIGKNAIRENYRNIFLTSRMQLKLTTNEIINAADLTIIRGNIVGNVISKSDSSVSVINDKFLMVLKKQAGKWKIYRLAWSKNDQGKLKSPLF